MRRSGLRTFSVLLLTLAVPAFAAPDRATKTDTRPVEAQQIEMHVGIPSVVYIGQPLADLLKKFPGARVAPFAGQDDASIVRIPEAGLSCVAVGEAGDLKLASVGFNMDGTHEGVAEGNFRTSKGIGKGSTVNDLLGIYGEPMEVLAEKPRGALSRKPSPDADDPSVPKMYQYASEDGKVKTYFLVVNHQVKRMVVNDLAPLDEHIVKGGQKK